MSKPGPIILSDEDSLIWKRASDALFFQGFMVPADAHKLLTAIYHGGIPHLSLGQHKPELSLTELVDEQANDEGLWCEAVYASEAYIQAALRRLHAAIENLEKI